MWKSPRVLEVAVGLEINCYACAEIQKVVQEYKVGRTGLFGKGKETSVKGSDKIKPYQGKKNLPPKAVSNALQFVSKNKNALIIAAKAPGVLKIPAILGVLGAAYFAKNKITKYLDKRTGKEGNIPKKYLGADAPKDTGGSGLKATIKQKTRNKPKAGQVVPQGKAYGGKAMKTYAKGGGMRKARTYG